MYFGNSVSFKIVNIIKAGLYHGMNTILPACSVGQASQLPYTHK